MSIRAAVLGAGSWGTTFAKVLTDACVETTLWARRPDLALAMARDRCNAAYVPELALPDQLRITSDPAEALAGADVVFLAVPAQALRQSLTAWTQLLPPGALLVSLMKGIEAGTGKRMSEVIREVTGVPKQQVAVISGPNLAHEIAQQQPAATVVACTDEDAGRMLQAACATPYLRPYTNHDVVGCELGGAVKNIIAILVGIAEGMGYGDNTRASIITRGLAETMRLGTALGAEPMTFTGLAGLGDLLATCASPLSRNRTFGARLGRGVPLDEVLAGGDHQVVEGVATSHAVLQLARHHELDMPIALHVVRAVSGEMAPGEVLDSLMSRRRTSERAAHER